MDDSLRRKSLQRQQYARKMKPEPDVGCDKGSFVLEELNLHSAGQRRPLTGKGALDIAQQLLQHFRVDAKLFQIGHTKIFLRAGVLGSLEDLRSRILRSLQATRLDVRSRLQQTDGSRLLELW